MAQKNSIDNISDPISCSHITVGNNSADPFIQTCISGLNKFVMGIDLTDTSFKISQGNALGTNDRFKLALTGEQMMPSQSAFLGYRSSNVNNITGAGTVYSLGFHALTKAFDQHNDFNTNGIFVAPVSGIYWLNSVIRVNTITDININYGEIRIVTTGRTYYGGYNNPNNCDDTSNALTYQLSTLANMNANDTATVEIVLSGGGSDVVGLVGDATDYYTIFSGYLVC